MSSNEELASLADGSKENVSLQDAFAKFRERKIKEIKLQKQSSVQKDRTEEYKNNLRIKFVEQCKKYIGIPYAERYKAPEDPIAPLYLDCCALVRKVVQDLQEDFGFVIGKWNQAYQMDTCPIEVPFEELKPGDLIFYIGNYTSKRFVVFGFCAVVFTQYLRCRVEARSRSMTACMSKYS